jgi:uncharacterized protein YoxC
VLVLVKQNTKEQILGIEEQIKRLKEKQKRIWEVEDVNEAKELIDSFNHQVKSLSEASSSKEDDEEEKNFPQNPPKG